MHCLTLDLRWSKIYSITPGLQDTTLTSNSSGTLKSSFENTFPDKWSAMLKMTLLVIRYNSFLFCSYGLIASSFPVCDWLSLLVSSCVSPLV